MTLEGAVHGTSDGPALERSRTAGLAGGVLALVLGVLILAWPQATLRVAAFVFAVQLIVLGAVRLWVASALPPRPAWLRWGTLVLGALTLLAGLVFLVNPSTTLATIGLLLGVGWVLDGLTALGQSVSAREVSVLHRLGIAVGGVALVVAGLVVAAFPQSTVALLARWAGILLLVIGVVEVVGALVARPGARPTGAVAR